MGFLDFFRCDVAIDLGTANTVIIKNKEVVLDEPSIIAMERATNKVIAVGSEAMNMHEKTHDDLKTIRPLKDGVIADFYAAEHMIKGRSIMRLQLSHSIYYYTTKTMSTFYG